jgi:hypothetical protein
MKKDAAVNPLTVEGRSTKGKSKKVKGKSEAEKHFKDGAFCLNFCLLPFYEKGS